MANRLANETSPYLLQHAGNPVDWYPWGEEALTKAREEDKPILLSVGYSSCHWCHVMERESFEDEATAALMNEHFVNIKVDREERPDIDSIYMQAVQALTRGGGWPMTVFLTPDGEVISTATALAPDGMRQVLNRVAETYAEKGDDAGRVPRALAGDLPPDLRMAAARPLRLFLDRCPACEAPVAETTAAACCGGPGPGGPDEVLSCLSCETRLFTFPS